jgi:FkbM family methyltransferase
MLHKLKELLKSIKHKIKQILVVLKTEPSTNKAFSENIFGHKMYANVTDDAIDLRGLNGVPLSNFTYGELGFWSNAMKRNQTVIDVGANIGYFTLLFARQVGPLGKVYAFEPGPISFSLLKVNILINGYQNCILENKAVSSKTETQTLYICPTGESDNRVSGVEIDFGPEKRTRMDIDSVSLDDYFSGKDQKIDFIKMDIQGGEYFALQGMQKLIRQNPMLNIALEFAPGGIRGIDPKGFINFINSLGFDIYDLLGDSPMVKANYQYLYDNYIQKGGMTNILLKREKSI